MELLVLEQMVVDLKAIESSDTFEEMLNNLSKNNIYYKDLEKANKEAKNEEKEIGRTMLFLEFRSWASFKMEKEILSYLKENI